MALIELEFDFGTDTAPVDVIETEGEPTGNVSAGSEIERQVEVHHEAVAQEAGLNESALRSSWREVPQALFLSWSDARQRSYCAARDRDSAIYAENDEWRQFYLRRADEADR